MNKTIRKVAAVIAVAMVMALAGCASSTSVRASDVPDWYLNPPEDGGFIFGIGSAKMQRADRSRSVAEHRARTSLTFQLEALVDAMETDYYSEGGTTNDTAVAEMFEGIDRQLASAAVQHAKITNRSVGKDGTVYAMVSYSESDAATAIKGVIESAASKGAKIKSDAALKAMDAAFAAKAPPKAVESGGE
jgi:type IV pilus biogenesis protein CpaD/CtpE